MPDDPCPTADALAELVEGTLTAEEADKVHHHVRDCTRCRMVLAGLGAAAQTEEELAPEPFVMKPGVKIARFQLIKLLGRGGMGSVWAATDPELGREVAIKVLLAGLGSSGDPVGSRARLLREAKAMARLAHPNVVPVFEVGDVGGRLFLVMEQVNGQTLGAWLREAKRSPAQILELFLGAGMGLAAAHAAGVIHRDFKPDNVLVGQDGRPRVTDFGLARGHLSGEHDVPLPTPQTSEILLAEPGDETLPSTLTPIGALLGTPAYMSPEQMHGQKAEARSDLFAWCTALFEALTGERPYPARSLLETRKKIEAGELVWPPSAKVPRWLRRELEKGLQAEPKNRHESMDELLAAIRRGRAAEEHRWLWFAAAAVLLIVVAAILLGTLRRPGLPHGARALAVLFPLDASPDQDVAWVGPALAELVTSELDGDPQLQIIPASEVAVAAGDLSLHGAAPLTADLPRLGKRLGADLILGGKYTLTNGQLTCELSLWRESGDAVQFDEEGTTTTLAELGARLGADARKALHLKPRPPQGVAAFPTNLQAARLYAEGLQLLHDQEAARAIVSLQKAAELAPDNPRIQLALMRAFVSQHEDVKAREAARRAFEAKGSLSPDEQLYAEILYRRLKGDNARAVELATARYQASPGDAQLGLALLEELNYAQRGPEMLTLSKQLQNPPPPGGVDPYIYTLEGTALERTGDDAGALADYERSYEAAKLRGSRKRMASARYSAGLTLRHKDVAKSQACFEEAMQLYGEVGDQRGAAMSSAMQATIFADRGDLPRARGQLEAAEKTFADIGDPVDEAMMLANLAVLSRRARDLPAARAYAGRSASLNLELGQTNAAAGAFQVLGNLRSDMGDLEGAADALTRSIELRRQSTSKLIVSGLVALADVRMTQADFPAAQKLLDAARLPQNHADALGTARIDYSTAYLMAKLDRIAESLTAAQRAADYYSKSGDTDDLGSVEALMAMDLLQQGHLAEARARIDLATKAIAGSKSQYMRMPVLVAEAKVRAAEHPRDLDAALRDVRAAMASVEATGAEADKWAAGFAIAELELAAGKPDASKRILALIREARSQGLVADADEAERQLRAHKINVINLKPPK